MPTITLEKLTVRELDVEPSVQRAVIDRHVAALAASWSNDYQHVLTVWRTNGSYYLLDGQQRWRAKGGVPSSQGGVDAPDAAAREWLHRMSITPDPDYTFTCEVHSDLTAEEAARIFLAHNRGRRKVDSYASYHVGVTAKDPVSLSVERAVAAAGYAVGPTSTRHEVGCVATMMRCMKWRLASGRRTLPENEASLTWALGVYRDVWGYTPPWRGEFVEALVTLHALYGDKIDRARLTKGLRTISMEDLFRAARLSTIGNNRVSSALTVQFVKVHDQGLWQKSRLEPTRSDADDDV